jgi:hypothetical protein
MTSSDSSDSKDAKVQDELRSLSILAPALNTASDLFTRAINCLDESLKRLNVGLSAWVAFRKMADYLPPAYNQYEIGYCKIDGRWGLAIRHSWGNDAEDRHNIDGPWFFNDSPRDLRLASADKLPQLISALNEATIKATQRIQKKTNQVLELTRILNEVSDEEDSRLKPIGTPIMPPKTLVALIPPIDLTGNKGGK